MIAKKQQVHTEMTEQEISRVHHYKKSIATKNPVVDSTSTLNNNRLADNQVTLPIPQSAAEVIKVASDKVFEFIEYLKKHPKSEEFIYLVRIDQGDRCRYNPYKLKIVDFHSIDRKSNEGYYTLSRRVGQS